MNVNIVSTSAAEHIGKRLSYKGFDVIFPDKNKDGFLHFPDGEIYSRISKINEIKGRTVVIHSGVPDPSGGLIELEMILDILSKSDAAPVEVFCTYFPYARQDDVSQSGETNFAKNIVEKLTSFYNVEKIYTIDAHFAGREWVKKYNLINVSAVDLLKSAVAKDYPEVVYLAPDAGSQRRTGLKGTKKHRIDSNVTEILVSEEFRNVVEGNVVGAVDDMINTGGTMVNFYNRCMENGAKDVIALASHGVLRYGIKRIAEKYSKLYLTNTIQLDRDSVDVTDLVAYTILK